MTMLFAIAPESLILFAIGPNEYSISALLVFFILSDVLFLIRLDEDAEAFHFVIDPVASEDASVLPPVSSFAIDGVLFELSFEG